MNKDSFPDQLFVDADALVALADQKDIHHARSMQIQQELIVNISVCSPLNLLLEKQLPLLVKREDYTWLVFQEQLFYQGILLFNIQHIITWNKR